MSHITSLLSRPSTLGFIAVAGSGAFYIGMKSRTMAAKQQQQSQQDQQALYTRASQDQHQEGLDPHEGKSYHVRAGERSGGGV